MKQPLKHFATTAHGFALGALTMYLFDPRLGHRRRVLARDKARRLARDFSDDALKAFVDLGHRSKGMMAEAVRHVRRDQADNAALEARVRSFLGHIVSHPSALMAIAEDGKITLMGRILESEADSCLSRLATVPGVHLIENRLEICQTAENHPELQGGRTRAAHRRLRPATKLLLAVAGTGAIIPAARVGWLRVLLLPFAAALFRESFRGKKGAQPEVTETQRRESRAA